MSLMHAHCMQLLGLVNSSVHTFTAALQNPEPLTAAIQNPEPLTAALHNPIAFSAAHQNLRHWLLECNTCYMCMQVKRPMVLAGCSIGASTVIDFALHHPEAIAKLVLMGPAAWNEGLGLFPWFPRWAGLCVTKVVFGTLCNAESCHCLLVYCASVWYPTHCTIISQAESHIDNAYRAEQCAMLQLSVTV